jgi:two-component system NtrC family sensor kinase
MDPTSPPDKHAYPDPVLHGDQYYQQLQRKNIVRLILTYLLPLIILTVYFAFQYRQIVIVSGKAHLMAIAENQANTLDLFLRERVVNLSNMIDNPKLELPPSPPVMQALLGTLKQNSETFADIGFLDSNGIQTEYAGPFPQLEKRDYGRESWWLTLKGKSANFIITDIYLGFRQKPHFTIAVSRTINGQYVVLRAALDPERLLEYIAHLEHPSEVYTSIVNQTGDYQIAAPNVGTALAQSPIIPTQTPKVEARELKIKDTTVYYAYSWLRTCDWALIVQSASDLGRGFGGPTFIRIFAFSAAVILVIFSIIVARARKIVGDIRRADQTRAELSDSLLHASKLAAVGEMASGIAHEINNPLAIINEEIGLIRDSLNPEFKLGRSIEDLKPSLDHIQEAVFRCRDITRKLLSFVRRTEMNLQTYDIHEVIDDVLQGFYEHEIAVSNIEIVRKYAGQPAFIVADKNHLEQVFLNLINNAIDAIKGRGSIVISTSLDNDRVYAAVSDTGVGMTQEQLDRVFIPFFTTKEVGKGTGLGLSISYGIIKSLGGNISVTSTYGAGSTFTIDLPLARTPPPIPGKVPDPAKVADG